MYAEANCWQKAQKSPKNLLKCGYVDLHCWSPSYGPDPTGDERRPPGSSESGGGCVVGGGQGWQGRRATGGTSPRPPQVRTYLRSLLMGVVIKLVLNVIL